jgi:hypothetical protein
LNKANNAGSHVLAGLTKRGFMSVTKQEAGKIIFVTTFKLRIKFISTK